MRPASCVPMKTLTALFLLCLVLAPLSRSQDFRRRERSFDALHYRIEVGFDEARQLVRGNVSVALRPLRPRFTTVQLDAKRMTIQRVSLASGAPLRFDYDSSVLTVHLDRAYAYGEKLTVTVRYECTPQRGLYFIKPNASYPNDPRQIWTQGQGEDNRHWFPCYDYPNDKATTEVLMTVRGEYATLSNGVLKSKKKNADGSVTWHWSQDKPHSVYLVMLAAGDYRVYEDSWDGIPVRSYHYPSDAPEDVRRAYGTTAEMVAFFSQRVGIRYPWAKYAQIPVAHYLYGGMENTSATVLADTRAVVNARTAQDYTADGLIAHELAHMWWGDYLTYIDWDNTWLNEGFATYFQQCWTEHRWGADEFAWQRSEGINGYLAWTDANGRVPVVTDKPNPSQNVYAKGAAVLHMLRTMLGEEQFWRVITVYGKRHALGSVESNDFKRAIEDVTGMSLQWFFTQWLYRAGYPDVRVTKQWDAKARQLTLRFAQVQPLDSLCGYFRLHLPVLVRTASGDTSFTAAIDGAESVVTVPLAQAPAFVSVDHGSTLCGKIRLEQCPEEWILQLRTNPDPIKRAEAGVALLRMADRQDARAAVLEAARSDRFWGVRVRIAAALAGLKPDTLAWSAELKSALVAMTGDVKPSVRANALNGLNRYRSRSLLPVFTALLADSSYYVEAAAMNCVMTVDSVSSAGVVLTRLETKSYQDVVSLAAMDWVARYRMRAAEPALLRLARPGGSVDLRDKALATLAAIGAPRDTLLSLLKAQLREPVWQFRARAASALLAIAPREGIDLVRAARIVETDPRVSSHMSRLLENR
jgi:aminopeptidase N